MTKRSALLRQQGDLRPFVAEDVSGNGIHAVSLTNMNPSYYPASAPMVFGAPGPFAGGANNFAITVGTAQPAVGITSTGFGAGLPIMDPGGRSPFSLSVDGWFKLTPGVVSTNMNAIYTRSSGGNNGVLVGTRATAPGTVRSMAAINSGIFYDPFGSTIPTGVWLHLAWSCDYPSHQCTGYSNGVSVGIGTFTNMSPGTGSAYATLCGGFGGLAGSCTGLAFYPAALSAGQVAAHYAASSTAAAYKAAVLADSPIALWMLNEQSY